MNFDELERDDKLALWMGALAVVPELACEEDSLDLARRLRAELVGEDVSDLSRQALKRKIEVLAPAILDQMGPWFELFPSDEEMVEIVKATISSDPWLEEVGENIVTQDEALELAVKIRRQIQRALEKELCFAVALGGPKSSPKVPRKSGDQHITDVGPIRAVRGPTPR